MMLQRRLLPEHLIMTQKPVAITMSIMVVTVAMITVLSATARETEETLKIPMT